jgi:solute carrier family 25 S-adenosylmethionine transporter 26
MRGVIGCSGKGCSKISDKFSQAKSSPVLVQNIDANVPSNKLKHLKHVLRVSLAGGLAGAFSTAVLFPLDTLKTLKQIPLSSSSSSSSSSFAAKSSLGMKKLYSGFVPSVLGSIPSSALYFGSYEASKLLLVSTTKRALARPFVSIIAAAMGNIISSFIFVPKDAIKSQMQSIQSNRIVWAGAATSPFIKVEDITVSRVVSHIFKTKGIKGFYPSYRATLARNIPSAILRFTIYEELRSIIPLKHTGMDAKNIGFFVAGAIASGVSSGLTTPLDVVKTRIATGLLPSNIPIFKAIIEIGKREGLGGLYGGVRARALHSGLFGSIGFVSFETFKHLLNAKSDK